MGLLDVHARTWHAPSRQEQIQKAELHRLEDMEHEKKRAIKHEINTLRKVEDLRHDNLRSSAALLNATDVARRRSISGVGGLGGVRERELLLLERERENRLRANAALAGPHSPQHLSVGHPVGAMGTPRLNVPLSPHLGTPAGLGVPGGIGMGTPRVRAVSHHGLAGPGLAGHDILAQERRMQAERNALLAAGATPRVRTLSSSHNYHHSPHLAPVSPLLGTVGGGGGGLAGNAALERARLEERKRNLMQRELALQDARSQRLQAKKSQLDMLERETAFRERERDLHDRAVLSNRNAALNREEAALRARESDDLLHAQLEERLRNLSVNTPSLNPLHGSTPAGLGHARHLSSPMAVPLGGEFGGLEPHMPSPRLGGSSSGLLGPTPYSPGHLRSRSHGGSPLMGATAYGGTHDIPHLGLNDGLGLSSHSPYLGAGYDLNDEYALHGAGEGIGSRRGSLSGAGPAAGGLGLPGLDGGGLGLGRARRESLPFDDGPLY